MIRTLVCLMLAACGGKAKPVDSAQPTASTTIENKQPASAEPTRTEKLIATWERFERDMCACTDSDCGKRVSDELTAWSQEEARKEPPKLTEEEQRRGVEIGTRMGECMMKAMEKSGASAP